MFFIGIFGTGIKEEERPLGTLFEDCPDPKLVRRFQYFHFFFLPLYRWDYSYFLRCGDGSRLTLKEAAGERTWDNPGEGVSYWDVEARQGMKTCPECGAVLEEAFLYCPRCGKKI